MICTYVKTIFEGDEEYRVIVYSTEDESVPKDARSKSAPKGKIWFTAYGRRMPPTNALDYDINGRWETGKYGLQLAVEVCNEVIPTTPEGMIGYLCSGMIKGIGPKTAKVIVDRFGMDTYKIIEETPHELLKVRGISEKKLQRIIQSYRDNRAMRDIVGHLARFDVGEKAAAKVYSAFGPDSMRILQTQPFQLCTIPGIGFKKADEIARKTNCSLSDPLRLCGALQYQLDEAAKKGHLFLPMESLVPETTAMLNDGLKVAIIQESAVRLQLDAMAAGEKLSIEMQRVYKPFFRKAEVTVAKRVLQMLGSKSQFPGNLEQELLTSQRTLGITLAEKQAEAVAMSLTETIGIITGGPGTGKTTVLEVILDIYKRIYPNHKIMMAAPTGRASKRMAEATGFSSASTLHSALGLISSDDESGFWGEKDAIDAQLVVIDEFSMIDMLLAGELFSRIRRGTQLLIIGDPEQLPSVGAGNVLRELIRCGVIPTTRLEFVYRQKAGSKIAQLAHLIDAGATKDIKELLNLKHPDALFASAENDAAAAEILIERYREEVAKEGLENVQMLAPMRNRGMCCVSKLNASAQQALNPPDKTKSEVKLGARVYRVGDKVMQIKNNYDIVWERGDGTNGVGVFNGDIGFIVSIEEIDEELVITVRFGDSGDVKYLRDELEQLELAYCCSIHKAQGGEHSVVLLPLLMGQYIMLRRNLLYTAVTRAKTRLYLVGEKKAFFVAVSKNDVDARNTLLADRIISYQRQMLSKVVPTQTTLYGKTGS